MPRLDLNPQNAAVLNRLLDQALDLEPAEREQWLAHLPEEFAALKPHLQDLLSRAAGVETADLANLTGNSDMAVARYAANGLAADTSFDTDGKLTIDFFGRRDSAQAVVQQADGKLVIGGFAQGASGVVFALARLMP